MRGQARVLIGILLVVLVILMAILLYAWTVITLEKVSGRARPENIPIIPPRILLAVVEENNVCVTLQNISSEPLPARGIIALKGKNYFTTLPVTFSSCGDTISPGTTCTICSEINRVVPSGVKASAVIGGISTESVALRVVGAEEGEGGGAGLEVNVSFTHGLFFSSPEENRYSNVLFFGDYNRVIITVTGPSGSYTISGDCIQDVSCSIEFDSCTVESNTTKATESCTITITGPASTAITFPVYYISFCDSAPKCESDLSSAAGRMDANSIVVLTADMEEIVSLSNIDFGWRVTFDGNGHQVDAMHLTSVQGLMIRNTRLDSYDDALSLDSNSSATIIDSNISATAYDALSLKEGSYIASATNAYCFFSDDPTPYPILSIDQSNYDLNISKYLEENAPGSPALCHVSVLADGVKIHDGNVGAAKGGDYLTSGTIIIHGADDVNIFRVNVTACNDALSLDSNSSATIIDSNISADNDYALSLKSSSATITDSNIHAYYGDYALSLDSNSSATIQNSTLSAHYRALSLNSSSATIIDSNISATYDALSLKSSSATIIDSNIHAANDSAVYAKYGTNHLTVDLAEGNVAITSPRTDWEVSSESKLYVDCANCGSYCLDTNFNDVGGGGTLDYSGCNASCLCSP